MVDFTIKMTMLNSTNGQRWIQDITSAFYRSNTNGVALGQKSKPALPADTTDPALKIKVELAIEKWNECDNLANSLIHDSLSPDYRSFFKWDKSSYENFNNFKKVASDNSPGAIRDIKKDLEDLQQNNGENIEDYYTRCNNLLSKLSDAGGSITVREQVELFLGTVGELFLKMPGDSQIEN